MTSHLKRHLGIRISNRYRYTSRVTGTAANFNRLALFLRPEGVERIMRNKNHEHSVNLKIAASGKKPEDMCVISLSHPAADELLALAAEAGIQTGAVDMAETGRTSVGDPGHDD